MVRQTTQRPALLMALADHVLAHGLNAASLRPMAAAAGTSDRMLIYHFGSKDALIVELLKFLAGQMAEALDQALPQVRWDSEQRLVTEVVLLMRSAPFTPYVRVWLDIVSAAMQGSPAHREAGERIIGIFLDWLALRHPAGAEGAALALTLIEGTLVMEAVGHRAVVDQAIARLAD